MTSTETQNTKTQNVPKLRFKGFDGEIKESLFGNHFTFHTTNSFSRDKLNYEKGKVRNIHYGDIHTKFQTHFFITSEKVPFINEDVDLLKIKVDSYCKVGDLIIADASEDYGDIGKAIELININNEKLLAGLHTFLARPSSGNTSLGFISFLLKSWKLRKQIMTIAQGTKVLSLSTGRVSNLKINLPTLPEQQKIASFLSAVDEKIQQLTKKKDLLAQYKKGVMQQLFSGKLRFTDENGNDYPDWEEKRLDTIIDRFIVPMRDKPKQLNGEIPWCRIEDFNGKYLSRSKSNQGVSLKTIKEMNLKTYPIGTLLVSCSANLGFCAITKVELTTNQTFIGLVPDHNKADVLFYLYVMRMQARQLNILSSGTTISYLSRQQFEKFKVPYPVLKEQQKIATYLSNLDTKIEAVTQQITHTQELKKGLLQQMFV